MNKVKAPQLANAMTPFPYSIDASDTLEKAKQLMNLHNIRHFPVKIDGVIDSIISERDIKFASAPEKGIIDNELLVGDFCAQRAYCVDLYDPLNRILDVMVETHIGAVLVFRKGKLVGIFTSSDAMKSFSTFIQSLKEETADPCTA